MIDESVIIPSEQKLPPKINENYSNSALKTCQNTSNVPRSCPHGLAIALNHLVEHSPFKLIGMPALHSPSG